MHTPTHRSHQTIYSANTVREDSEIKGWGGGGWSVASMMGKSLEIVLLLAKKLCLRILTV